MFCVYLRIKPMSPSMRTSPDSRRALDDSSASTFSQSFIHSFIHFKSRCLRKKEKTRVLFPDLDLSR